MCSLLYHNSGHHADSGSIKACPCSAMRALNQAQYYPEVQSCLDRRKTGQLRSQYDIHSHSGANLRFENVSAS